MRQAHLPVNQKHIFNSAMAVNKFSIYRKSSTENKVYTCMYIRMNCRICRRSVYTRTSPSVLKISIYKYAHVFFLLRSSPFVTDVGPLSHIFTTQTKQFFVWKHVLLDKISVRKLPRIIF